MKVYRCTTAAHLAACIQAAQLLHPNLSPTPGLVRRVELNSVGLLPQPELIAVGEVWYGGRLYNCMFTDGYDGEAIDLEGVCTTSAGT